MNAPSTPRGYKYILFVPPRDRHELLWSGERTGVDEAVTTFGADEAFPNSHLSEHLSRYLGYDSVYASLPPSPSPSAASQPISPSSPRRRTSLLKFFAPSEEHKFDARDPPHLMLAAALAGNRAKPLEQVTHRMRVRKSDAELRLMKKAADISGLAHKKVMGFSKVGGTEAQIAARFEYECALNGSERPAYVPVVASGANSLVIHYTRNDCVLDENDVSEGAELQSRSWKGHDELTNRWFSLTPEASSTCMRRTSRARSPSTGASPTRNATCTRLS